MRKLIYLAVLIVIGVAVTFFYLGKKNKKMKTEINSGSQPTNANQGEHQFIFHPDAVVKVKITWGKSELSYERKDNMSPWAPQDYGSVQELLNALSFANGSTENEPNRTESSVQIEFNDGQQWGGAWDKEKFVWTDGSRKGNGIEIPPISIFRMGAFFGTAREISICPSRLKSAHIKDLNKNANWLIQQEKLNWKSTRNLDQKTTTVPIDPNFIEMWLGQHCNLSVEQILDLNLLSEDPKITCQVQLNFEKEKKELQCLELVKAGSPVFKIDNMVFQSQELYNALIMLQNTPFGIPVKE